MFTCRGDKLLDLLDIHINTNNGKPANNDLNDDSDHSYCEVGPPSESPCPELDPELQELLEEIENDDLENEIFDDDDKDPDYIPEDLVASEVMFPNAATECSSTTECEDVTPADPVSPTSEIGDQVEKCVKGPKTRNRIPDTDNWKRNAVKRKIRTGEEHKSASGRVIAAKLVKFQDCSRCVRKCNENFSESKRNEINQDYWNLGDVDKQRLFLNSLVSEVEKKVTRTAADVSRRQKTRNYYFNKAGDRIQVCQRFFLATLSITDTVIKNMLRKRAESGVIEKDRRGCHIPGVKKPESSREYIINHINSFPRIPSHYCRKDTKKDYLPQDLNLQKMYDLYVVKCSEDSVTPEKISFYRNIFHTNFNIAFHCPRKDVCDQCYKYERMDVEEKEKMKETHDSHLARKVKARNLRDEFKEKALNGECNFAEFDFEAVRYCPSLKAKAIFYKRRLAVYNLTVYNVATKYATNYMWHEATAGRGSKEVASCLFNHMKEKSNEESTHWVFMSDTCGGQNRNVNVTTMFLYAVQKLNISLIDQLFFEPGHSQMECDSVHAQIEKASRDIEIFDPSGWYTTVRLASRGKKYEVNEVNQSEVYDFQELQKNLIKNRKIDMKGNVVRWLDITWLQYRKTDPMLVFFKYDQSEEFEAFAISRRERRKFSIDKLILKPAYCGTLPIENNKLSDLMKLCSSGVIREQYHSFYGSLVGDSVVNADDE